MAKSFDERGREVSDPTPVEIPVNFRRPETLQEQIRRLIRTEMSVQALNEGKETFDEADDFDIEPDEPRSQWELDDDQLLYSGGGEEGGGASAAGGTERGQPVLPGGDRAGTGDGSGEAVAPAGSGAGAPVPGAAGS